MKAKRKNAPHLADQVQDGAELIILVGSKAWQAWDKGNGLEWSLLAQAIKTDPKQKPVILGPSQLEEINVLNLAENDRTFIRLCQFGKFSHSEELPAVVANLAKNTQVQKLTLCDSLGHLQEDGDLSAWLKRTREQQGESVADMVAKSVGKKSPVIDFSSEKPTQKQIAQAFLDWVDKPIRRDIHAGKPLEYNGLYWEQMPEHHLQRKVMDFYDEFGGDYTARHLKSIADLIVLKAEEIPAQNPDFIGFQNGVLNKKTGEFTPHEIGHFLRSVEELNCNTQSKDTPHFDDWIEFVSNGNTNKKNAILAGLYTPQTGEILADGVALKPSDLRAYSNNISAVFSDFYLFDYATGDADIAREWLALTHLQDKVELKGAKFSTTSLSSGQRKRLALVSVLMDGRKFLMLDEFAADLDPQFRTEFYERILPELKSRGYTIFAISHDDKYFSAADKIYKMQRGEISRIK